MLRRVIEGRWLRANGVVGLYPAATVGDDDIEIYRDESRSEVLFTWRGLRVQSVRPVVDGVKGPNRCLADFIAPKGSGKNDYIGLFAVTAGLGVDKKEQQFAADLDDYSAIMLKALADRLAEAFAERLHQRVRTDLWGYAADESLDVAGLVAERYRGIRPAPGYPACPDHTVKRDLFRVLGAEEIGMTLTESLAMLPAASVVGLLLRASGSEVLQRRPHRARSTEELGRAQREQRRRGRAGARAAALTDAPRTRESEGEAARKSARDARGLAFAYDCRRAFPESHNASLNDASSTPARRRARAASVQSDQLRR